MTEQSHTVTFQAKGSAPPPPSLAAMQSVEFGAQVLKYALLALVALNVGFALFAPAEPPVKAAAALLIGIITAYPAWALSAVPYFKERRPQALEYIWPTIKAAVFVALLTAVCAVYAIVRVGNPLDRIDTGPSRPIAAIQKDHDGAARWCHYGDGRSCLNKWFYGLELTIAERKAAPRAAPVERELSTEDVISYGILAILAVIVVAIAYSWILYVEASRAIQDDGKPAVKPDMQADIKRDGLNRWLRSGRIAVSDGTEKEPVDRVFEEYRKFLGEQIIPPPAYDIAGFKKAFKDTTTKEPQGDFYIGVTFPGSGLA